LASRESVHAAELAGIVEPGALTATLATYG
jgi:hypothetical protein